ncbi:hypothetical protein RJ498_004145 [Pluralibacter gergoviae]
MAIILFCVSIWSFFSYIRDFREKRNLFIVKIKSSRRQHPTHS